MPRPVHETQDYEVVIYTPLVGRSGSCEHHQPTLWHLTPGSQGGLKMTVLSWRTELNRDLTHFPDVAMIRITYESEGEPAVRSIELLDGSIV